MCGAFRIREAIGSVPDGGTIIDVPCGGGVALRSLRPEQRVRYLAVDLDEDMLERARRRAAKHGLGQVELFAADMRHLPFADGLADVCLTYSGLHMIPDPDLALIEMSRCLRSGGKMVGATFLAGGSPRQRFLFALGARTGHVAPTGGAADLERWLKHAGLVDVQLDRGGGFVLFRGRKG